MELKKLFDSWAENKKDQYKKSQWLLSKWETIEGIEWPQEKIQKMIRSIQAGLQITAQDQLIDLGCGGGWILEGMKPYARKIYGLDISHKMLLNAERARREGILVCAELGALPFRTASFSFAFSYFVFMNFQDDGYIERSLREIVRILKKGGRALVGQLADRDGAAEYDQAKKDYLNDCKKRYSLGQDNREISLLPLKLYDRKKIILLLESLNVGFELRDSFNPFYRPGKPETVDWRFDIIIEKR